MANGPRGSQMPATIRISNEDGSCITIPCSDQKKVVHNIVVFLNPESSDPLIKDFLDHHKNVSLDTSPVEVLHGEMKCCSVDIYKLSLKELVRNGEKLSDEFTKTLLLQITRGLEHVHKCGKTFGPIKSDHIHISSAADNAVLTDVWMEGDVDPDHGKEDDIKYLGRLFYFVLSRGGDCPSVDNLGRIDQCPETLSCEAIDLIKRMIQETASEETAREESDPVPIQREDDRNLTAKMVQNHPFFWTASEKIGFLCDAFDSVKHPGFDEELENQAKNEVFVGEWFGKLKLRPEEVTSIQDSSIDENGNKKQINPNTIFDLAQGKVKNPKVNYTTYLFNQCDNKLEKINSVLAKHWQKLLQKITSPDTPLSMNDPNTKKSFNEALEKISKNGICPEYEVIDKVVLVKNCEAFQRDSFYDLLRFFRNRKAHYCESKKNIERCFQSYPNGFWKFFSSRYPNMLPFVYRNRNRFNLCREATKENEIAGSGNESIPRN